MLLKIQLGKSEVFACACIVAAAFVSKVYAGHRKRAIHRDVDIFEQLFIGAISIDLYWTLEARGNCSNLASVCIAGYCRQMPPVVVQTLLLFAAVVQPNLLLFHCSCSNTSTMFSA